MLMIRKGVPWGRAASGPADLAVSGDDAALADAVAARPGARVAFLPSPASDFARAVGLAVGSPPGENRDTELPCDLLMARADARDTVAVNMIIVGVPPDRETWRSRNTQVRVQVDGRVVHVGFATAVVIANGQYLRGSDVVPRGHPGDGRAEVHIYALARSERRGMRERLPRGEHVPHPRITVTSGHRIEVESLAQPFALEVDGVGSGRAHAIAVGVTPEAFSLLV